MYRSIIWKIIVAGAIIIPGLAASAEDDALARAISLYDHKRYEQALKILDSLVAINPDDVEIINNRGLNRFVLGDHAGALADYAKVISINPRHAKAINNRGYVKFSEGNTEAAISDYETALSINPELAKAYNNRGVAKISLRDTLGAIRDYDKALSLDAKLAEAFLNRGTAYYFQGNIIFAQRDYNSAIMIDGDYAEAYFGRGLTEYATGDKIGACSDWNTSFALGYSKEYETINRICLPDNAEDNPELNPADFNWVSRLRILTESGLWEIKPTYMEVIGKVAKLMKAYSMLKIEIQGHADSINRSNDKNLNKKLSQKRAEAVRDILIASGISPKRLSAIGYGESRPVEPNRTEEGREQNRRIEFVIEKSYIGSR
ncbi:hypothetical protein MASR2M18_05190 [Ignavibacteria bacterium]|nr:tetratricopeptide repeat protein [Bacteroidota bacterium]MCZ2132021.1 tetratricopeptide repeat protein [Bacteroidota bacterium]